jgi:hypothetical protein
MLSFIRHDHWRARARTDDRAIRVDRNLDSGVWTSPDSMVPKTAAAAGAGSGTLAKMTTICEQVRVGIAGILANIAGHPVAVGAAPAVGGGVAAA